TGTYIGPAAGENPRGTGDPSSPYATSSLNYAAWLGRAPAGDCSAIGYLGPYTAFQYRRGGSLQSAIAHGTYTNGCFLTVAQMLVTVVNPSINTLMTVTDGTSSTDCTVGGGTTQHNCLWNGTAWVATS